MTRLWRFRRLPPRERRLLVRAVLLLVTIRLALWFVPFHRVRQLFVIHSVRTSDALKELSAERLEWAVRNASHCVPATACLCQSLALQWLLARAGYASTIRIGVRKDPRTGFEAHAWVEQGGRALLSRPSEVERYAPLLGRDGAS